MATTPQPAEKKKKARNEMGERGPNPAHKLLDAISAALKSPADRQQIIMLVDMARKAFGTDQGQSWKMVAGSLHEMAEEARQESQDVAQALTAATTTLPGDENGVAP